MRRVRIDWLSGLLLALFVCLGVSCADAGDDQADNPLSTDQPVPAVRPSEQAESVVSGGPVVLDEPAPEAVNEPDEDVDMIAVGVEAAESGFRAGVAAAKRARDRQIKAVLEREMQRAADAADLDALEALQQQLNAFESYGTVPELAGLVDDLQLYRKALARLGDELVAVYRSAMVDYTRARDVTNARLVEAKIRWVRPTAEMDTHEDRGRLYLLVWEKVTWEQAKGACEALGGYLACINDEGEQQFIYENIMKDTNAMAWVGATDAHREGDWVWLDGTRGYWPWAPNEPTNWKNIQHFAALDKYGKIGDFQPVNRFVNAYLCEWNFVPTRETVYGDIAEELP